MNSARFYVKRNLSWFDEKGEEHLILEDDLLTDQTCPIVILGEPGMGKTSLMQKLVDTPNSKYLRATTFLRQQGNSIQEGLTLIIDGLDEVAAKEDGDPLHNVLKKLVDFGNPPFVISCRAAEWHGETAKLEIQEDYCDAPKLLDLVPLTKVEATEILSRDVGKKKSEEAIETLCRSGLDTFYQNPLNLEFVAATLMVQPKLPETKADLIDYATIALCREENESNFDSVFATLSEKEVLDVAGCLMATMLIAGKESISKTHASSGILKLPEISDLIDFEKAKAVLASSRLFRTLRTSSNDSEGPKSFIPMHRMVAEFLGARWLASEVEKKDNPNRVARRLLGLISAEGGVPASLRGLHAWLLKFSPNLLGPKVIDQDPYGILRYGDGNHLSAGQARQIIHGLRQMIRCDPSFRYPWWETQSNKGLAQIELIDEIRTVVRNPDEPWQLRSLLIDAIRGPEIATKLIPDLQMIMMDTTREFVERRKACFVLIEIEDHTINWPSQLQQMSDLDDDDSNRLVIESISKFGIENFDIEQVANAVAVHVGIAKKKFSDDSSYTDGSLGQLADRIPATQINALLDQLARIAAKFRGSETWWETDYVKCSRRLDTFSRKLVSTLLKYDSQSVQPEQLWNWICTLWSEQDSYSHDSLGECELITNDDRLRLGIQRLALFAPDVDDDFRFLQMYLSKFCESFEMPLEDARVHLSELVQRNNPTERRRWRALVNMFRSEDDNLIPEAIQKIARPYAEGDPELVDDLTKKPKPLKPSNWEKKHRQRMQKIERRRKKELEDARKHYSSHIDEIRSGELQWILQPAQAYLGMFIDLKINSEPSERISEWLGDDISQASLIGLEAVLHRSDLPTTEQIVEGYSNSTVWNFMFPMLAAAGQRFQSGRGFEDLPTELIQSLAIIAEHESSILSECFSGLTDKLNALLRKNFQSRENHLRQKFEPMLASNMSHIPGLYQFVREDIERPLSTRLSLEWLERFPNLPRQILDGLVDCVIYAPNNEREEAWCYMTRIVEMHLDELNVVSQSHQDSYDSGEMKYWLSVQFLVDFEKAVLHIPDITEDNRDWLWSLTRDYYDHFNRYSKTILLTIDQLKWIVMNFRHCWPKVTRPGGATMGITNPWDATDILEHSIYQIAKDPSDEAALALSELRDMPYDDYTNHILSAIAQNRRVQIEAKFKSPTISQIKTVLTDGKPESATDVQSIVLESLSKLQDKLRGDSLDVVNNFYSDDENPRNENECVKQMLIVMGELPYQIQSLPEVSMPQGKRSDVAFVFGDIVVPLEAKGQWHRDVWTSAINQLDRYYCRTSKSASKGIYVVFWFGENVPKEKKLKPLPEGNVQPETAEEMRIILQSLLPLERRPDIEIVVLDVTK